jgi:hypothetical protein
MPPYSTYVDQQDCDSALTILESTEFTTEDKKTISFNKDVVVHYHIHVNDMTEQGIRRTWYNSQEIARRKAECVQTVERMIAGKCREEDTMFCSRGLEYRTPAGSCLRRKHKFAAWDAVQAEQTRQWQEGVFDAESLAKVYIASTDQRARVAHLMAISDERFLHCQQEQLSHSKDRDSSKKNCCIFTSTFLVRGCIATKVHNANAHRLESASKGNKSNRRCLPFI